MKDAQRELVSEMLGKGIKGWADVTLRMLDEDGLVDEIYLVNREESGADAAITYKEFIKAATDWSTEHLNENYPPYTDFARDWLNHEWDQAQYNNDICNQIHQQALFGEAIYS